MIEYKSASNFSNQIFIIILDFGLSNCLKFDNVLENNTSHVFSKKSFERIHVVIVLCNIFLSVWLIPSLFETKIPMYFLNNKRKFTGN